MIMLFVWIGMKCFSVFLVSLLAQRSFAANCNVDQKVNITLIRDSYLEAIKDIAVPIIESGDNAGKFKAEYSKVASDYIHTLIVLLYNRADEISQQLIKDIQQRSYELQKCIESIESGSEKLPCAQSNLKSLTHQCEKFLELNPGDAIIKDPVLADIPPPQKDARFRTTKRTPAEIFLHLVKTFSDFAPKTFFQGFTSNIHITGWHAARTRYNTMQTQIRNEFLNNLAMPIYRRVMESNIDDGIRRYVDPETWKPFKECRDRIRVISDEYNASRDRECDL